MSRPDMAWRVSALEFVAYTDTVRYSLHEGTLEGPPLDADVRVLVCPKLDPTHAAAILEEVAGRLRQRGRVAEAPLQLREVRALLCRIGGGN